MLRKAAFAVLTLANVSLALLMTYYLFRGGVITPASAPLEYKDFVAILLTALGVMIALGALLIAVLAVWTYKNAMELITAAADKAARERVDLILPGLVEDQMRFEEEDIGDAEEADKIAGAYAKEEK
jgi:hypothetical protein